MHRDHTSNDPASRWNLDHLFQEGFGPSTLRRTPTRAHKASLVVLSHEVDLDILVLSRCASASPSSTAECLPLPVDSGLSTALARVLPPVQRIFSIPRSPRPICIGVVLPVPTTTRAPRTSATACLHPAYPLTLPPHQTGKRTSRCLKEPKLETSQQRFRPLTKVALPEASRNSVLSR
jgi:hypothetical protein